MWNVSTFLHFLSHHSSSTPIISHMDQLQDLLTGLPASDFPHPLDSMKQCVTDNVPRNSWYFMFSIRTLTFSLDLVFFSPMDIIWGLRYYVALMEERVQQKQETICGCFFRVIGMSTMGIVGGHSPCPWECQPKAQLSWQLLSVSLSKWYSTGNWSVWHGEFSPAPELENPVQNEWAHRRHAH